MARQARLDERAAILQAQIERERRTRSLIIAGFAVLIIGGGLTLYFLTNPPNFGTSATQTTFHDTSYAVPDEGRNHVAVGTRVDYKHLPPSSGPHYPSPDAPKPASTYVDPIRPEYFVHDLEHGAIVLVYRCGGAGPSPAPGASSTTQPSPSPEPSPSPSPSASPSSTECSDINSRLFSIFGKLPKEPETNEVKFMSTPFPDMQPKFALLAWDRELDLATLDENTIIGFYHKYVDRGPEMAPI